MCVCVCVVSWFPTFYTLVVSNWLHKTAYFVDYKADHA